MPVLSPQQIYQGLVSAGVSPLNAAALDAISNRESSWNTNAESGYRPSTGDYFSTGLFQFNLGANYGPQGNIGLSGPGDIWGSAIQNALGGQNPYYALQNNPSADFTAAAMAVSKDGLQPWEKNGNPFADVSQYAMQQAVNASGGAVTMAQLQGLGSATGGAGGPSGNPIGGNTNTAGLAQGAINQNDLQTQIALQQQLAQIDAQYAQQEAQFQRQLLMLSEASLQIQEGALGRQEAEAPILQEQLQKQYELQYAGIKQSGQDINRQYRQQFTDLASSGAASGSLFTKGARDEHANMMADWASQTAGLQRQRSMLQSQQYQEAVRYMEQLAAYQDQQKQFDIMAQRYGISAQEISSRLQATLGQTNIGAGMNVADLFSQLLGVNASMPLNLGAPPTGVNYSVGTTYGVGSFDPYANNQTGQLYG